MNATPNSEATIGMADDAVGSKVGRYTLLEQIGAGGFGLVFRAEQYEPVRRQVALKILKLGMDTRDVVARFEVERQALAMMDHPNIAKVFDAGATASGRPYFVMELLQGERITHYCDKNKLSVPQRLELFVQVCHAIQHAHQKGIIHRDIKPSNVLVTSHDRETIIKVIDFGIAKATEQRLTDKTVVTAMERLIGTPAYMSPEQVNMAGQDVDTRSDIYSLGVLLYELLTGRTPFDPDLMVLEGASSIQRTISELEPVPPATKLSTLKGDARAAAAECRGAPIEDLVKGIRGDLDWIVMKCLEKDRARRYDTANGLALDIRRHLECQPVSAGPPSKTYRLRKAWQRHKTAFAAAALMVSVLMAATGISAWQAIRATRAEALARQRLADSEAISKFLAEVFQSPDPTRQGRTITVSETLGLAAKRLDADLATQPARRAKLQATLGGTYGGLGLYREAIPLQEKARDFYLTNSGLEHTETLVAMLSLAASYDALARRGDALKLREQVLAVRRKILGPEHPDTLIAMSDLANSYDEGGRPDEALKLREEVLTVRRKVLGPKDANTLAAMQSLAISYRKVNRRIEMLLLQEQALALSRDVLGPEHPATLSAMYNLGIFYDEDGHRDKALKIREEVQRLYEKVLGPEHPVTLRALGNLANSYAVAGRGADALRTREKVLALDRKTLGPEHPDTLVAMYNLAGNYEDLGRRDEALQLQDELLGIDRKLYGPESPDTLWAMANLATFEDATAKYDEARHLREQVLALRRKVLGPEHPDTFVAMQDLANSYNEAGLPDQALALLETAINGNTNDSGASLTCAIWQAWYGHDADYEATRRHLVQQAESTNDLATAGRAAKAYCALPSTNSEFLIRALNLAQRAAELGTNDSDLPWYRLSLGLAEYRNGQFAAADQTLTLAMQTAGPNTEIPKIALPYLAMSQFRQNRIEEARKTFHQAQAQVPRLPKEMNKPQADGKPVSQDVMVCWLGFKEAQALLNESTPDHP
jgi:serine/threonine protein kinase